MCCTGTTLPLVTDSASGAGASTAVVAAESKEEKEKPAEAKESTTPRAPLLPPIKRGSVTRKDKGSPRQDCMRPPLHVLWLTILLIVVSSPDRTMSATLQEGGGSGHGVTRTAFLKQTASMVKAMTAVFQDSGEVYSSRELGRMMQKVHAARKVTLHIVVEFVHC